MPTISPVVRASIGGTSQEPVPHRVSLTAQTGMNMPEKPDASLPPSGQTATHEATTPTQAVTLSPQLTALARKQQKLQQEIQAQRDKEAAWTARQADYVPKSDFKAKLKENAAEALNTLGISYDELTNLLLEQQNGADPVKALKAELDQLKNDQKANVDKQYEATLRQYRAETDSLIAADPKTYHLINKQGRQDAVVQHILETWKEDESKVLSVSQAAKEVEDVLREQAKKMADALKELEPATTEETPQAKKTLPPPKAALKTLTNQVDVAPTRTYNQFQFLSPKERLAQAIARASK